MHDSQPLRLSILGIVAVALFTALFSRLWFLQVMAAPDYEAEGVANRTRTIVVEGPRGRILDRNGKVLAQNREAVVVTVDKSTLEAADDPQAVLAELVEELTAAGVTTSVQEVEAAIAEWNGDPYRPIVVAEDVSPDLYVTLSERASALPGVGVEKRLRREYPYGTLASHVLGYIGEINADELAARSDAEKAYQLGDTIGKGGVEKQYESALRGTPGSITFQVDSMGRIVSILDRVEPRPGKDVWLTIDADLQGVTERALAEEIEAGRERSIGKTSNGFPITAPAGAAVVEDPRTGEVLAMASYPTFDPNELTRGVSLERWNQLGGPDCKPFHCPVENKAIRGQYAPGSTFKIFTAYAAASTGARPPGQSIEDGGSYRLNPCNDDSGRCVFENSGKQAHGWVDMQAALTVSSNVYFFGVGEIFARNEDDYGDRPIQDVAEQFGMGGRTGIPLPNEAPGVLIDPELKAWRHEQNPDVFVDGRWQVGDTVNLAIGQGDISVTPLQLANAYATMANGGNLHAPNIALKVTDPETGEETQTFGPRVAEELELDGGVRDVILRGLEGVTTRTGVHRGTAATVFTGFPNDRFPVAGKTGTAQRSNAASSSVFAAFAPVNDPRYALSVFVEEGGYGSSIAAPIARRILEPLAHRDLDGTPLVEAPRTLYGEQVEDVSEIEIQAGGSYD